MTGSGTLADPYIGEIRQGREIGFLSIHHKWIWTACIDCGKERWVLLKNGKPNSLRCNSCATKRHGQSIRGENNPRWKGGEIKVRADYNRRQKLEALKHYSGDPPKCACCREAHIEFLSIDHINGNGSRERRKRGYGYLYGYLKKEGYPSGYRVLCLNCNLALGHYGYCPHQKEGVSKL